MQRPLSNSTCSQLWPIAAGAAKAAIDSGAAGTSLGAAPTAPKPSQQKLSIVGEVASSRRNAPTYQWRHRIRHHHWKHEDAHNLRDRQTWCTNFGLKARVVVARLWGPGARHDNTLAVVVLEPAGLFYIPLQTSGRQEFRTAFNLLVY